MQWFYSGEHQQQLGPVTEKSLIELIRSGKVSRSTMVWNDALPDWIPVSATPLARFAPEVQESPGAPVLLDPRAPRDPAKVYPRVPPRTPHVAWLNLIFPGLGQLLLGQVGKGILFLVLLPCLWFAVFTLGIGIILIGLTVADAFMVGLVLQSGRPVGRWQFFPR